jgi:hypothetical protein
MRALTMDEVDCVSGGLEMKPWEGGFYSATWQNSVADSFSMMSAYSGLGQQMNDYHQQQVEQQKAINGLFNISDQSAPNSAFGTGFSPLNNAFSNAAAEGKYAQACASLAFSKFSAIIACYDTEADIWLGLGAGYSSGKGLSYEVTVDEHKLDGVVNMDASTTVDHKIYNFNGEVTGGSSEKYGFGVSVKENVSEVIRGVNNAINNIGQEMYRYYKGMEIDLIKAD